MFLGGGGGGVAAERTDPGESEVYLDTLDPCLGELGTGTDLGNARTLATTRLHLFLESSSLSVLVVLIDVVDVVGVLPNVEDLSSRFVDLVPSVSVSTGTGNVENLF
ncbi:unnamed protein product [Euphydryas editha]|uniref:Uncharacterized protein n=1 Tax=Euphydryas editha TaxID=104508 RepID=A0AAU9T6R7_EUPED|nr:unnamed protein product [Euphydryas editha]